MRYKIFFIGQADQNENEVVHFFEKEVTAESLTVAWENGQAAIGETVTHNEIIFRLRSISGVEPLPAFGAT